MFIKHQIWQSWSCIYAWKEITCESYLSILAIHASVSVLLLTGLGTIYCGSLYGIGLLAFLVVDCTI